MSFRAGLTIAALALAGCSPGGASNLTLTSPASIGMVPGAGVCAADKPCELTGIIMLQYRSGNNSWASLSDGGGCAPLLLPKSVYQKWRYWSGKRVRVIGTALTHTPDSEYAVVSMALYRDRWLPASICGESNLVIYVDRIALVH